MRKADSAFSRAAGFVGNALALALAAGKGWEGWFFCFAFAFGTGTTFKKLLIKVFSWWWQ